VARQQAADVPDRCGIGREVTAEGPVDLQLNQTRREQAALAIDDEVFGGIVTSWLRPEARMPPGSKTTTASSTRPSGRRAAALRMAHTGALLALSDRTSAATLLA